jgi:hypothetical protein
LIRQYLLQIFFIFLAVVSSSVYARIIDRQDLPEKIFTVINKKHPKAEIMTIEDKTHFGQPLYAIKIRETQYDMNNQIYFEETVELFRPNGHFYTNEINIKRESFDLILPSEIKESLHQQYPDYKIQEIQIVTNPNSIGEEYDIALLASGRVWNISIDSKGKLISTARQE